MNDFGVIALYVVIFLLIFFIVFYWSKNKEKSGTVRYDERQNEARGKAYEAGYFTIILYMAALIFINEMEFQWFNTYSFPILAGGVILGIAVFAVVAITKDAYLQMNKNRKAQIIPIFAVSVLNIVVFIVNLIKNHPSKDFWVNGLCALLGIIILITILIHDKKTGLFEEKE